jgi:hypothetical protein
MFKDLVASTVGTPLLSTARISFVAIAATATAVALLTGIPTHVVALVASTTATVILLKKMFVTLGVTATVVPSLIKKMFKTLSATVSGVPVLGAAYQTAESLVATAIGVAALVANKIPAGVGAIVRQMRIWLGLGLGM